MERSVDSIDLFSPVTALKGVGPARARQLEKLGIFTLYDLIAFFPRGYEDRTKRVAIAALEPDVPLSPSDCLNCGRCQRACPQGALQPDGSVELSRCRSHITQKKGELTEWEIQQIRAGGLIWGCDICNDVCPCNREPKESPVPEFLESAVAVFDREQAEKLLKTRAFNYRGKKTILRNIALLDEETVDGK